jgi:hypothetical protein
MGVEVEDTDIVAVEDMVVPVVVLGASTSTPARSTVSFKGNTRGMNGHVFQCNNETTDKQQFSLTIEALAEYIAKFIRYAKDVASLCRTGKLVPIKEPADLSTVNGRKRE